MPRTPHPTLKTFEEFLTAMEKEGEDTKRYFFKQIEYAQKERERYRVKANKAYDKIRKAKKLSDSPEQVETNSSLPEKA